MPAVNLWGCNSLEGHGADQLVGDSGAANFVVTKGDYDLLDLIFVRYDMDKYG
jgi:hypothetical protein